MKELLHRPQAREEPAKANCLGEGQLKRKVSRAAEGTPRPEGRGGHYSPIFRWSRSSCAACPRPLCSSAADCTAELHGQIKWLNFNCGQRRAEGKGPRGETDLEADSVISVSNYSLFSCSSDAKCGSGCTYSLTSLHFHLPSDGSAGLGQCF